MVTTLFRNNHNNVVDNSRKRMKVQRIHLFAIKTINGHSGPTCSTNRTVALRWIRLLNYLIRDVGHSIANFRRLPTCDAIYPMITSNDHMDSWGPAIFRSHLYHRCENGFQTMTKSESPTKWHFCNSQAVTIKLFSPLPRNVQ